MSLEIPQTVRQWTLTDEPSFDALTFSEQALEPLADNQVLVKIQGASLNYRDFLIPLGLYPFRRILNVVPGADGAGTVLAIGKNVTRFAPGDKVITLFNQGHIGGSPNLQTMQTGLGCTIHGTLRSVGAFDEQGLVAMPPHLSFVEAATLSCAGLTAWNALFGLSDRKLGPGQYVLTQGTGGVSIFAIQFAKVVGAKVIATTSSDEKAKFLRSLGADHVLNYRETPEWGTKAREITGGVGVDHLVDVVGPASMNQSLKSIKVDGVISLIGLVGGVGDAAPDPFGALNSMCITRGILVGSRVQMEEMCRAVEAHPDALRPILDPKVFTLEQVREAYEYQWAGKHQGKVGIQID